MVLTKCHFSLVFQYPLCICCEKLMFPRFIVAISVLAACVAYYMLHPITVTFHINSTIADYPAAAVFQFIKNPQHLIDICYSVQSVNVSECSSRWNDNYEMDLCQYSVIQNFLHVGSQRVFVYSVAFPHNRTIHQHATMLYNIISVDSVYTFSEGDQVEENSSLVSESGDIVVPRVLTSYANRIVQLHKDMINIIDVAMSINSS